MKTTILEHIENPNPELVEKVKEFQNRKEQGLKELEKEMNDKGKLQNNFTTVEQSKRLLDLGLPADSADCYYTWKLDHTTKINVLDNETYSELLDHVSQFTIPCWSVGRLMEIFVIARGYEDGLMSINGRNSIEYLIRLFAMNRDEKFKLDFSKLED